MSAFMTPITCWCGDLAEWFYNPAAAATAVITAPSFWHKEGNTTTPMNGLCQKHRPLYEIKEIRPAQYGPQAPPGATRSGIKVDDVVLWKKGDGVFLKVTAVWPSGLTGRDANDTAYMVSDAEVTLHPPHKSDQTCEMCEGPINKALSSPKATEA